MSVDEKKSKVTVVLGAQYGDEGKGKITDMLAEEHDVVVRFQGGANAGHTIYHEGEKYIFHQIPSGVLSGKDVVLGNGMVVDPAEMAKEYGKLLKAGFKEKELLQKIHSAKRMHIIFPGYIADELSGIASEKIGSTLRGIGPTYAHKAKRDGLRLEGAVDNWEKRLEEGLDKLEAEYDKFREARGLDLNFPKFRGEFKKSFRKGMEILGRTSVNLPYYIQEALRQGKDILIEGAQGTLLDLDFGTYPYVTSSNPSIAGVSAGTGIPPQRITKVIGIFKAYMTRVGKGPFHTKIGGKVKEKLQEKGCEFGATTGRPRDCGWLDLVALDYANRVNGFDELYMIKADVLGGIEKLKVGVSYLDEEGKEVGEFPADSEGELRPKYQELPGWEETDWKAVAEGEAEPPEELENYARFIEKYIGVPVSLVSVGPERNMFYRRGRPE